MKYCTKCGNQLMDEAVMCPKCGCMVEETIQIQKNEPKVYYSELTTATKVFMIIGTIIRGFSLIPLAWCIPMTIIYCKKIENGEELSTSFKVCSLLFVSLIGGILMFCDEKKSN